MTADLCDKMECAHYNQIEYRSIDECIVEFDERSMNYGCSHGENENQSLYGMRQQPNMFRSNEFECESMVHVISTTVTPGCAATNFTFLYLLNWFIIYVLISTLFRFYIRCNSYLNSVHPKSITINVELI